MSPRFHASVIRRGVRVPRAEGPKGLIARESREAHVMDTFLGVAQGKETSHQRLVETVPEIPSVAARD